MFGKRNKENHQNHQPFSMEFLMLVIRIADRMTRRRIDSLRRRELLVIVRINHTVQRMTDSMPLRRAKPNTSKKRHCVENVWHWEYHADDMGKT